LEKLKYVQTAKIFVALINDPQHNCTRFIFYSSIIVILLPQDENRLSSRNIMCILAHRRVPVNNVTTS